MKSLERSLQREADWDERFFERERRATSWNQWFWIGRVEHCSELESSTTVDVAGESIVSVRDRGGAPHAHRNCCRHRGSRLTDV